MIRLGATLQPPGDEIQCNINRLREVRCSWAPGASETKITRQLSLNPRAVISALTIGVLLA
jgi:hypothetical protein